MKIIFTLFFSLMFTFSAFASSLKDNATKVLPNFEQDQKVRCLVDEDPRVGYLLTGLGSNRVQADIVVEGVTTNPGNTPLSMSIIPLEEILSYHTYLYYERIDATQDIPMSVTIEILFPKEQSSEKLNAVAYISPAFAIQKPDGTYGVGESLNVSILPLTCEIL